MLAAVASSSAAPAATDVSITLGFGQGGSVETGKTTITARSFRISVIVEASSFVPEPVRLGIRLSDGLRWGSDPTDGCTGTAPAVCTGTTTTGSGNGGNFAFWSWPIQAERTGQFEITASVEGNGLDPDTSNNTATFRFEVVSPTGGGGGGGSASAVTTSAVKLSPAKPKAGSTLVASVRVTKGGSAVRPSAIGCAASIGRVKVKGASNAANGVAACLFKTPRSAKGKSFAGSVSFRAGGSSFTKRFAATLA